MSSVAQAAIAATNPAMAAYQIQWGEVEIDVPVFLKEIQARLNDPSRTYEPPQTVSWQYDAREFSVGFRQKCVQCGHVGNRAEFNTSENPPYICRECGSGNIVPTGQSERKRLPMIILTHGLMQTRVFPNKLGPQGELLTEKDQMQHQIPQLIHISLEEDGMAQPVQRRRYRSPFDGKEFDTGQQLAQHLEAMQTELASGETDVVSNGAPRRPVPQAPKPQVEPMNRHVKRRELAASLTDKGKSNIVNLMMDDDDEEDLPKAAVEDAKTE